MTERGLSFVEGCYLDNKGRDRCETTNKVAYASEQEAKAAARARRFYIKTDLSPYLDESCQHYHLTSNATD